MQTAASPTTASRPPEFGHSRPGRGQALWCVLGVDDLKGNRRELSAILDRHGYSVTTASNDDEALAAVAELPDLVLLDAMMPGLDGFEVCARIKANPRTRMTPVVLLTELRDMDDGSRGLEVGADDIICQPLSVDELHARVRALIRTRGYTDDLDSVDCVLLSLGLTIEARDPATRGHCQRLATLGAALGAQLGLNHDGLTAVERGGFLHDLGKIGIPDGVLLKPGPLTRSEFEQVKQHPVIGDRLCGEMRSLNAVRPIIRSHHEHLDGSGYPDGLRGDAIPILAQIVGIVDTFDAVTTARVYKPAQSVDYACAELAREARKGWRRTDFVTTFIELVDQHRSQKTPVIATPQNSSAPPRDPSNC